MKTSTYWLIIKVLLILLFSTLLPKPSLATSTTNMATIALEHAINDTNRRLNHYRAGNSTLALVQTSEDQHGNILQQAYSVTNVDKTGRWQVIKADEAFSQTIDIDNNILLNTEKFNYKKATLAAETSTHWIFSMPNVLSVNDEEQTSEENTQIINNSIAEQLLTEMIIDKSSQQISGLKIYTLAPFKPSFLVTVKTFEIRLSFNEAWPDGPIIRTYLSQHMAGSYGWLIKINDIITTKVSNIEEKTAPQTSS